MLLLLCCCVVVVVLLLCCCCRVDVFQMRAMNEFSLVSDWSEVASLNLTTVETSTNPTTTDQDGLPVYGAVLISLVLIIVGGISIALAVMCVVVHYRRHIINKSVSRFHV